MSESPASHAFEVFYDGDCPLCKREIGLIRRMDRRRRILFTDIADPLFRPETVGKTMDELMAQIYGRLPDGSLVTGVEVFRRLYGAIGVGPVVWLSRLPGISGLLDWSYRIFARNRLRFTGRCAGGVCKVNLPQAPTPSP
jgi:predicted DCC family thiol-disulfide oxidoreductase YuxK